MPVVFTPPSGRPTTIGDEYRLYARSIKVPVVDDVVAEVEVIATENAAPEEKTSSAETKVDPVVVEVSNGKEEEEDQPKEKKRALEDGGADDGPSNGEGTQSDEGPSESKRSKIAAVPGEGDDGAKRGETSGSVRAEPEPSDAKQETNKASSPSEV
jgi:hypothetical protein